MRFLKIAIGVGLILSATVASAASPADDLWAQFRARHPYHVQTLAISKPRTDGTRLLVLSEPPPQVTMEHVRTAFGRQLSNVSVRKYPVGFDGYVKDLVATVAPMGDAALNGLLEAISSDLFGTSYKTYALDLEDSQPQTAPVSALNLSVSSAELRTWVGAGGPPPPTNANAFSPLAWVATFVAAVMFVRKRTPRRLAAVVGLGALAWIMGIPPSAPQPEAMFVPLHGEESSVRLSDLLSQGAKGVYLSEEPGVVALLVPRRQAINDEAVAIREFALDSDLILGAVGSASSVALIGRERALGVEVLPPLRTETILQLAAVATKDELAQSYERRFMFAGRFDDQAHLDWAPIYLSNELQDTEYGSLLNITDQILKSWSQHGQVEYVRFKYEKPHSYPFPLPLNEHVNSGRVTFNWNTKGVGYLDEDGPFQVEAIAQTGSLPVDYLGDSDSRLRDAEDRGYQYFSHLGDPNLVRVVQYATVYQIWHQFGVRADYQSSTRVHNGPASLRPMASKLMEAILDVDFEDLAKAIRGPAPLVLAQEARDAVEIQSELRQFIQRWKGPGKDAVISAILEPRNRSESSREPESSASNLAFEITNSLLIRFLARGQVASARTVFAEADGGGDAPAWIKTPSIVVSWPVGNQKAIDGVGGHNLGSRITGFQARATVPVGEVEVTGEAGARTVFYNPADEPKLSTIVRLAGRDTDPNTASLQMRLAAAMRGASAELRPMSKVLAHSATERGLATPMTSRLVAGKTWRVGTEVPPVHASMLKRLGDGSNLPIVIERRGGKYVLSSTGEARAIEADTSASALDAVVAQIRAGRPSQDVHLHFEGMDAEQARVFNRQLELQSPDVVSRTRTTVAQEGDQAFALLSEAKKEKWNWSRARTEIPENVVGTMRSEVDVAIDVPNMAGKSVRMKIKLVFTKVQQITASFLENLKVALNGWIQHFATTAEQLDLEIAARRIRLDLEKLDPSIEGVKLQLADQSREATVVQNRPLDVSRVTTE